MLNLKSKMKTALILSLTLLLSGSLMAQDLAQGIKLTRSEQFDAAKSVFDKLIAAEPNNGDNYFYYGENYLMSHFADTISVLLTDVTGPAAQLFKKGTELDPENPLCYIGLGKVALMTGATADAVNNFNMALSKLPSKTNKTSTLSPERQALTYAKIAEAMIQPKIKTTAKALELVTKAGELDTKNPEIFLIWGDVFLENNDGSSAIAKYKVAQELDPQSPSAKLRLGKLWVRARNWTEAINYYNEAIEIDASFAPAYVELGAIYMRAGQAAKAKTYFEKYLELSNAISAKVKYLSVLLELKDYTAAIPVALEIKQADPNRNDISRALAYCYFETKNYAKALEYMELFFANAKPEKIINSDYVYYGDILSKNKKDSLAILQYTKVLELDSTAYEMYSNIAESHKSMKNNEKAVEWYNKKKVLGKMTVVDWYKFGMLYYNIAAVSMQEADWKMADTIFAEITSTRPDFMGGKSHLWRGRCNSNLDTDLSKGLANIHYQNYIQIAVADSVKNAKDLIEAYDYFQYYYLKNKDYCNAKLYVERILWTDPEGKIADIPKFQDLLSEYTKNCQK